MDARRPRVRATGILVQDDAVLLVKQVLREQSHWNLPGGGLEMGETLEHCLVREMHEETGLQVTIGELLYVCDRFKGLDAHVLDLSFSVKCASDECLSALHSTVRDECLAAVRMVPFAQLEHYGFSHRFVNLLREGFPQKGTYQGDFHAFYG